MLKVGLVGAGNISKAHVNAWKEIPEAMLVAVCDIRPEKSQEAAEASGAATYTDYGEMLRVEALDILDICTPTNLHADFAVRAMEKGIHVLTEKPVSLHREDVARVYGAAKKHGVRVMVAQVLRFWREYALLKEAYETGKYGRLLSGSMSRLGNRPKWSWDDWMADPARSGLVPFDLHIHDLDFIVYAFGKPQDVRCDRARNARQDYLHAVYDFGAFFIATEAAWFDCTYAFRSSYRFQFERTVMEFTGGKLTLYHQDDTVEALDEVNRDAEGVGVPATNAYYNEIRYFTDCVLAGKDCDRVRADELEEVLSLIARLEG